MRLQCRVTPAEQELLNHLESIPPAYRAKRLIVLAAMFLSSSKNKTDGLAHSPAPESPSSEAGVVGAAESNVSRKPAAWIKDAKL